VDLPRLGLPFVAHDLRSELLGIRNLRHVKHKGASSEPHLLPRSRLVCPNVPSSISCVNPQGPLFSLVLPHLPPVPTVILPIPALASYLRSSALCLRASSMVTGRISAPAFVSRLLRIGSLCVCALALAVALIPACSQPAKGRLSVHRWLLFMGLSTIVYPSYNSCTSPPT